VTEKPGEKRGGRKGGGGGGRKKRKRRKSGRPSIPFSLVLPHLKGDEEGGKRKKSDASTNGDKKQY